MKRGGNIAATNGKDALKSVISRSRGLGLLKTVRALYRLGDPEAGPLSRLLSVVDTREREFIKVLGEQGWTELLAIVAAACRLLRDFSSAAFYFRYARLDDELERLKELIWAFGDYRAALKLGEFRGRGLDGASTREFVVERVIPMLKIGGDQFRGFKLDQELLASIHELCPDEHQCGLFADAVRLLRRKGCVDAAKLYVLANHSGDTRLIGELAGDFMHSTARRRGKIPEMVQQAWPRAEIRVFRKGDACSLRPEKRFIIAVRDGDRHFVLKELLALPCDLPGNCGMPQEAEILGALDIPGVSRFEGIVDLQGVSFVRLGYRRGKALYDILSDDGPLPLKEALSLCRQLAGIIEALHEAGVGHLDIRDDNLLWDGRRLTLLGFDISRRFTGGCEFAWILPGAAPFMAPETVLSFRASPASDLYQLGLVIHRLIAGRNPFGMPGVPTPRKGGRELQLLDFGLSSLFREGLDIPPAVSDISAQLAETLRALLDRDPARRPPAGDVCAVLRKAELTARGRRHKVV